MSDMFYILEALETLRVATMKVNGELVCERIFREALNCEHRGSLAYMEDAEGMLDVSLRIPGYSVKLTED